MQLVVQSPTRPERIIGALEDIIPDNASEIRLSVAYVSTNGTELLIDRLTERLMDAKWKSVTKQILTCFDYGITEPEALTIWSSLPGASVYIQNADLALSGNLNPQAAFHAKMYEFRFGTHANLMVGSANLSERALVFNSEAATVHTGLSDLKALDTHWKHLRFGSRLADAALIKAYALARAKQPPPPTNPVPTPVTVPSQSLWDAVSSGACDPESYEYFWLDAGYLSGGSQNQLELPRGANRFFDFHFEDYEPAQESIGTVTLAVRATFYNGRPLSWHGDNGMERINLPTDYTYLEKVILFRRRTGNFQLIATPSGSQRSAAWASASETVGRRYRVGQKGARRCGLF